MGTVTQFPATMDLKTAIATLGQTTLADIEAEIRAFSTTRALEALATIGDLVAITLRREVGEKVWDIKIQSLYYAATEPDADGKREQMVSYIWDAEECQIGLDEDEWELPNEIMCRLHFDTAAEALADAEDSLAKEPDTVSDVLNLD